MSATSEELSVTFEDVEGPLTLPVLEDRVEEIVEENLVYRDAFRPYDATNINSNVVQIPVPKDDGGSPKIVDEGAEFPRSHEEYELKNLDFDKFGFEVPLTMEAVADSRGGLTQDQVNRQARDMAEDINARAFDQIKSSTPKITPNTTETMTYNDILAGREKLVSNSYSPDLLVADVAGVHDLMKSDNFLRATELGDQLRRDGALGRIAGMEVVEDDSGLDLTGNSATPGALMVDTDLYGYEGERDPVTSEEYSEDRSQTDVYRIFSRMGWLVTQNDAGVIVEG